MIPAPLPNCGRARSYERRRMRAPESFLGASDLSQG